MTRVLVTDHVFDDLERERAILEPLGAEVVLASAQDEATLAAEAAGAAGLLVCFAPVTEAVVDAAAAGGCRIIARYGIGVDNVDVGAARRHGIAVTNVPDYCLDEVADHTLALMLAAARDVAGGVGRAAIHRLAGRRLALIGLGGIGRRVAARAMAFRLEVTAYDPYVDPWDVPGVSRAVSLEDAVGGAHFVSLHTPLTPETHRLVDERLLAAMRERPVLVNTARGGLVDLDAVMRALDAGTLAAVALDVTEPEPLPARHPLRNHPRALLTPHVAFHSVEATDELQRRAAGEVARALTGLPPERPVAA